MVVNQLNSTSLFKVLVSDVVNLQPYNPKADIAVAHVIDVGVMVRRCRLNTSG